MGNKRRVVVTGLGCVSPLGNSVPEFWTGLKEGRSGITAVTKVDVSDIASKVAGEVKNFDPSQRMDGKEARTSSPSTRSMRASRP